MLRPEDHHRLRHMIDNAREAIELAHGKGRPDLDSDRVLGLALVRLLEIVGEAAGRVSPDVRQRQPAIPWPQVISLRNRLIHGYDSVDMDILWQILQVDLPAILVQLEELVESNLT